MKNLVFNMSIKWRNIIAFLAILILFAQSTEMNATASSRTGTENWEILQHQLSRNRQFIAFEIISRYELPGDEAPMNGQYRTIIKKVLSEGEQLRELSEKTREGDVGVKMGAMNFGIADRFANHPEELFPTATSVDLVGREQRDGEDYIILKIRTLFSKKGNFPLTAKIWILEKNSHPVRVEGVIENVSLPGVKNISFTVKYDDDENGRSFPSEITISYPINIFFHHGKIFFQHTLSSWRNVVQRSQL
ncbi:hypothetical protein [Massilia sp. DWR3-1-1]|uniref:hypothetical protein n=1 Tax=Massilia sp. DWR3-1-1 TaxID=2804559 RepID=UPI003CE6DFE8